MDDYEATRILFSRVQNLDPENASKIMGLLLLQDHGEKEIIRLAFGPEALIHSMIIKARKDLGLHSNSSSSSPFLPSKSIGISRQGFASSRPGISLPSLAIPNPYPNQDDFLISPNNLSVGSSSSSMNSSSSSSLPPYGNGGTDIIDEFQLQDQLSFLPAENPDLYYFPSDLSSSPTGVGGSGGDLLFASYGGGANWCDDSNLGLGWRPCLYYARGYCKNGSSCRFSHSGVADSALNSMLGSDGAAMGGSPGKVEMMEQCNELLRSKSALQQRLAAASTNCNFPYSPKSTDFLLQQQQNEIRRVAAALTMAEDSNNFGRFRLERNDFSMNCGVGLVNPAARQIYLTFPADSTFKEEDVSKYFSIYGPVQDVRIPYQQKRMFGFVTFVYPETVKLILAKGNPHFVCDSRVLVKPYKEKGKVPEKFRKQQQMERGDFSPCGTPSSLDSRELHDLHLGPRMFYNSQDMLWRRKLEEQADLQQALELQARRLMSLQLLDVKKPHHHHPALSTCSPIPSPTQSPNPFNQNLLFPSILTNPEVLQENGSNHLPEICVTALMDRQKQQNTDSAAESDKSNGKETYLQETSLEHNLPESPFASTLYEAGGIEADDLDTSNDNDSATSSFISTSNLGISSFKSFNCQYSSGHGAIGMYAGAGGPTCPVGI